MQTIREETIKGCIATALMKPEDEIVSRLNLPPPLRPRLSDSLPRPRRRSGLGAPYRGGRIRHPESRSVRLLEVRGREPGSVNQDLSFMFGVCRT
ncbi:hypothetical protein CF326_g6810 [Tilletia indica]|nr:hypothetical protein CF326_g6810 [Tilletia indica]